MNYVNSGHVEFEIKAGVLSSWQAEEETPVVKELRYVVFKVRWGEIIIIFLILDSLYVVDVYLSFEEKGL